MTAVEWLEQQLGSKIADTNIRISAPKFYELINQAKNMEINQKNEANNGDYCACCGGTEFWNDDFLTEEEE